MRSAFLLSALLWPGMHAGAQEKGPDRPKTLPNGVYAVLRESVREKDVLPIEAGEALIVHRSLYQKKDDKEPPRFLVVRPAPDVALDLAEEPRAVKEGDEVVRILLKLRPKAAAALERLTADRLGKHIAIVLGGEVATMHRIREVIRNGEAQITSCAPGAAGYLLEQLQRRKKEK